MKSTFERSILAPYRQVRSRERGNLAATVGKNGKTAIRGTIMGQWCIHERGQLGFICNYVSNGWFVVFGWPPLFRLKCEPEKRNKKKNFSTLLIH